MLKTPPVQRSLIESSVAVTSEPENSRSFVSGVGTASSLRSITFPAWNWVPMPARIASISVAASLIHSDSSRSGVDSSSESWIT